MPKHLQEVSHKNILLCQKGTKELFSVASLANSEDPFEACEGPSVFKVLGYYQLLQW